MCSVLYCPFVPYQLRKQKCLHCNRQLWVFFLMILCDLCENLRHFLHVANKQKNSTTVNSIGNDYDVASGDIICIKKESRNKHCVSIFEFVSVSSQMFLLYIPKKCFNGQKYWLKFALKLSGTLHVFAISTFRWVVVYITRNSEFAIKTVKIYLITEIDCWR